jgi:hypothetical protein
MAAARPHVLPKNFRLPGKEVRVRRLGRGKAIFADVRRRSLSRGLSSSRRHPRRGHPPPPEPPSLTLLRTIAGEGEGLAMFMEPATQIVVRLRTGEAHQGWVLRSVRARYVLLEKDSRTESVSLPDPGSEAPWREDWPFEGGGQLIQRNRP